MLLCLCDHIVKLATSLTDLLYWFVGGDRKATHACSDYLLNSKGKNLVFLLDGYDELPPYLQKDGFIADTINCKILYLCCLVILSRPHASENVQLSQ